MSVIIAYPCFGPSLRLTRISNAGSAKRPNSGRCPLSICTSLRKAIYRATEYGTARRCCQDLTLRADGRRRARAPTLVEEDSGMRLTSFVAGAAKPRLIRGASRSPGAVPNRAALCPAAEQEQALR